VRSALKARAELAVFGTRWEQFLGARTDDVLVADGVGNEQVGALYASAGIVLNDHWKDMRKSGFVSNRLMDAAACGTWIISDEVAGVDLHELFAGLVQTFRSTRGMRRILADRDRLFPHGEDRLAAAARVAAEHSFDHRARLLLDEALTVRARKR
jgi:O-antigen biosynthesis protein